MKMYVIIFCFSVYICVDFRISKNFFLSSLGFERYVSFDVFEIDTESCAFVFELDIFNSYEMCIYAGTGRVFPRDTEIFRCGG